MRRRERDVSGGMPVLGKDNVFEALRESVDDGDDLVAIFDGERTANSIDGRAEVVLDVDDEEGVAGQKVHYCLKSATNRVCRQATDSSSELMMIDAPR